MKIKKKTILEKLQPLLGPWDIDMSGFNLKDVTGKQPVFIFHFAGMEKVIRHTYTSHICEFHKNGKIFPQLDDLIVFGDERYAGIEVMADFFSLGKNGLIPFATLGGKAKKGQFQECRGILFLDHKNSVDFKHMPVVFYDKKEKHVYQIADEIDSLKFERPNPNEELSMELKNKGNSFFGKGELDKAKECYYKSIIANPLNPDPYNNLAMVCLETKGNVMEAQEFFHISFLINPEYANGMRGYAGVFANRGDLKTAAKILKKAINVEKSVINYASLSEILLDLGKLDEAKNLFEKAKKIDPQHWYVLRVKEKMNTVD